MSGRAARRGTRSCALACAGVFAAVLLLFSAAVWAMYASEFRHSPHLKVLGIVLKMYTNDHNDYYPPLSPRAGRLMFEQDSLYPDYMSEPGYLLISPADPNVVRGSETTRDPAYYFEHSSYFYLGYKVWNDETVRAFADAYRQHIVEGLPFDGDLPVKSPIEKLTRLDEAVRRRGMITDAESAQPKWEHLRHPDSEIPLLIERPHPYPGAFGLYLFGPIPLSRSVVGGTVLYQDGHVEFIPYPGKWPMTEATISALKGLSKADQ